MSSIVDVYARQLTQTIDALIDEHTGQLLHDIQGERWKNGKMADDGRLSIRIMDAYGTDDAETRQQIRDLASTPIKLTMDMLGGVGHKTTTILRPKPVRPSTPSSIATKIDEAIEYTQWVEATLNERGGAKRKRGDEGECAQCIELKRQIDQTINTDNEEVLKLERVLAQQKKQLKEKDARIAYLCEELRRKDESDVMSAKGEVEATESAYEAGSDDDIVDDREQDRGAIDESDAVSEAGSDDSVYELY